MASSQSPPENPFDFKDKTEMNPDILRAELAAMATPDTLEYSDVVYGALKNIQFQCAADFSTYCGSTNGGVVSAATFSLLDQMSIKSVPDAWDLPVPYLASPINISPPAVGTVSFHSIHAMAYTPGLPTPSTAGDGDAATFGGGRRTLLVADLQAAANDNNGLAVLQTLTNHLTAPLRSLVEPPAARRVISAGKKVFENAKLTLRGASRNLDGHENHDGHNHHKHDGPEKQPPVDPAYPNQQGPGGPDGDPHHPHPQGPILFDTTYSGAIGFGTKGDICLYKNAQKLSDPCKSAVVDLFNTREDYFIRTQGPDSNGCDFMPPLLIFLGFFFLISVIKRCMMRKRIKQVMKILRAIDANPSLKTIVENESGEKMPELPPDFKALGIVKCTLLVIGHILLSFLIALSSLITASVIVENLDSVDPSTGEIEHVSPPVAIFILFSIILIQVSAVVFAIKRCRKIHKARQEREQVSAVVTTGTSVIVASAPTMPPGSHPVQTEHQQPYSAGFSFSSIFNRSSAEPSGYVPLNAESEHGSGAEMVSIPYVLPVGNQQMNIPYTPYTGVPSNGIPVPVSSVSMI